MNRNTHRVKSFFVPLLALGALHMSALAVDAWTLNNDGTATNAKGRRIILGADGLPGTADDNQLVNPAGGVILKNARVSVDANSMAHVALGKGFNIYAGADQKLGTTDDVVKGFGRYPQSDVTGAMSDPLDWRVLSIDGGRAILAASVLLDSIKFNLNTSEGNDWSKSNLRAWLNSSGGQNATGDKRGFYNVAFNEDEKHKILSTKVSMISATPYQGTDRNVGGYSFATYKTVGTSTQDRVWTLSGEEVFQYFGPSKFVDARIKAGNLSNGYYVPSEYAKAKGVKINTGGNGPSYAGYGDSWTRSPGARADYGVFLGSMGSLNVGRPVDTVYGALPVITVSLR